ncbi:Phosphatidylinositol/phosphatidylcholine transfer protein SFH13 [Abeliophyllum distichum]|uniref:Phosphatidylinositol/phosphatidylcholine transfer protein SFH13 n=1 Tax=Abeliophyllum distichum TaxID=126358 RepID=A0ABD1QJ47_9LAMI
MAKIDNSYYPETLHCMYIVNAGPGFKKVLWPAAQKFLDPKTIAKIHVLDPKSLGKLLEVIDPSQLPDFLGGSCTCAVEGGCLRSNKGPWNDPEIMKIVYNEEATFVSHITKIPSDKQKIDSSIQIRPMKGISSDTSIVESGPEVDDSLSPLRRNSSRLSRLDPVHEEAGVSDTCIYYSCDDHFSPAGKDSDHVQVKCTSNMDNATNLNGDARENIEGTLVMCWLGAIQEKVVRRSFRYMERTLVPFMVKFFAFIRTAPVEYWRRQTNIYPSNALEDEPEPHNHSPVNAEAVSEQNRILPCVQRLQRLESLLEEFNKKPPEIPLEKEQMIQQSLDRIKSVEFDLEKTKRVLNATVMKQLEIAELLENMQESRSHRRWLFC